LKQTICDFDILLVDNGSTECGTKEYFNKIQNERIRIKLNNNNEGVNRVWDDFSKENYEYLCFLNNDVRISKRFIQDTIEILDKEEKVGIVNHVTNNIKYQTTLDKLTYDVISVRYMQGWDFTIRKSLYTKIPDEIKIFCGDDWLFHNIFERGFLGAIAISSPIIHYQGKSKRITQTISDFKIYTQQLKNPHYLKCLLKYSNIKPSFQKIIE